jgi:hypothetical protein
MKLALEHGLTPGCVAHFNVLIAIQQKNNY